MQLVQDTLGLWGAAQRALRVQVLGAATPVGRELSALLLRSGHPPTNLALAARRPHACSWNGVDLAVGGLRELRFVADVVFLCSPHPDALEAAEAQVRRGSRVIDLAGVWRGRRDVPLAAPGTAVPEVGVFSQLVRLPARSALLIGPLLAALHATFELAELHVVVLASVASEGSRGMQELFDELSRPGEREEGEARLGNVLLVPSEGPGREVLFARELATMIGRLDLPIDASVLRVDTERCDSFAVHLRTARPAHPEDLSRAVEACPGAALVEDHELERLAPRALVGEERLHVGRIRAGSRGPGSVCFFAVGDQLRLGAGRAALEVAARFARP